MVASPHTGLVLVFDVGPVRFGLPMERVDEVVRAVALQQLPGAPAVVAGAFVLRGEIIPLFDLRARFGLEAQPLHPSQRFIVASARSRRVALRADAMDWIREVDGTKVREPATIVRGVDRIRGVAQLEDALVLIQDLDAFLDDAESAALDRALEPGGT